MYILSIFLFIIYLCVYTFSETVGVLKTRGVVANSGAEIRSSSLNGLQDVTICARFSTKQFSVFERPYQILLNYGRFDLLGSHSMLNSVHQEQIAWIGSNWEPHGVVGYCWLNEFLYVLPIWEMGEEKE